MIEESKLMDENTINPTMNDVCLCPFCDNDKFYSTDYGREFCSSCRKENPTNTEYQLNIIGRK